MVDTSPAPLPGPILSKRKVFFIGFLMALLLALTVLLVVFLRSGGSIGGSGFRPKSTEVVVWTVGTPKKVFESLSKDFNSFVGRSDMKIVSYDFTSYGDLFDTLSHAVINGQAPDIISVPNHGGHAFYDTYVSSLSGNTIDFADFENRYHRLFFDELVYEEKTTIDGSAQIIRGLRGIPLGFEPLGIYYNRELMPTIPTNWDSLPSQLTEEAQTDAIPAISLGYGHATTLAPEMIPFLTIQYKGEQYSSYASLDSAETRATVDRLLDYRDEPNNLAQYSDLYDATLTDADLFVRGKVATFVGYPSSERDILLAIKRAKKSGAYDSDFEKNIRFTTIPQATDDVKKQINMARYSYLSLVKSGTNRDKESPNNDPVLKFLQFVNTPTAQNIVFKNSEYMLPTQTASLEKEAKTQINSKTGEFTMTVGDWYVPTQRYVRYDMGIPHLFGAIVRKALDEPGASAGLITGNISGYITCQIKHLRDPESYNTPCGCRTDVQSNDNHYWPVCEYR